MRKMILQWAVLWIAAVTFPAAALAEEQTLLRGFGDNWQSLDPQISYAVKDSFILADIYEGLVSVDAGGKPVPGAAESWIIDADGLIYTFKLRPDLKWANGAPLTAEHFVAGMQRLLDPATASYKAYYLTSNIIVSGAAAYNAGETKDFASVGIKALDPQTIEIKLDQPNPHALELLNSYVTAPLPADFKDAADFTDPAKGIANGAYMLKEVAPQSHVLLVKNPAYWDAANVKLDAVRFQVTEDVNTELKLYQTGELHMTNDVPLNRLKELRESNSEELHVAPIARPIFISLNFNKEPLKDIRIRKALALAIDRDVLEGKVMAAGDVPILSYVPLIDPAYTSLRPADFKDTQADNVALAKQLMAEAGYGPDKPLNIRFHCFSDDIWKRRAETIAVMWQQTLGVVSEMQFQESQAHWDTFYDYEWDAYCDSVGGDYAGAEPFLLYRAEAAAAGYNWVKPEYEALIAQVLTERDAGKRNALLAEAEQILLDDYVLAPLASVTTRRLVSKAVSGWVDNPIEYHLSKYMSLKTQ